MVVIAPQFLLDSSVLIEALRRASPDLQAHLARHEGRLATSTVVVSELYFGAARANDPELGRSQAERLLELVTVLDLDRSAADHAAQIRADLARKGTPIGPFDVLIAGHARSRGLTVVTANLREFQRVDGLLVEDWTR